MLASFETIKRLALEQLSVLDFLRIPPPVARDALRWQRLGETSSEASDRWRREQACLSDGYCRYLQRMIAAEKAVRESTDIGELRRVLRRFDTGGCDDVSHSCRVLLKRIDRQ